MARDDWFRRTTWSDLDAQGFRERLGRSRSAFHKAQYLRIQALTLAETRQEPLVLAALELLQRVFLELPEPSELASAHLLAAQCHEFLGNTDQAIGHFRLSLHAQAEYLNRDPGTALDFPWFVVMHGLSSLYGEALSTLQKAHLAFPVQLFKAATVRALVAHSQGNSQVAAQHAREALEAAALEQSQFPHHRSLGLVGQDHGSLVESLRDIAAA